IDFLSTLVANPFQGLLPGTSSNGATIARSQLLRPYPQFGNIRSYDDDGTSTYNSAQFKLERRFSKGYSVLTSYTRSRFPPRGFRLNQTHPEYSPTLARFRLPPPVSVDVIPS